MVAVHFLAQTLYNHSHWRTNFMAETKKSKKSAPAKAKGEAPAKKPAATQPSLIDTSLAAATAAKMVAHHTSAPTASTGEATESAAFKKLKEGLSKPSTQGLSSFISNSAPTKKSGTPFGVQNQMKRGQTFGADVNRTGVPRRTGG
jgi:hypothetical protein